VARRRSSSRRSAGSSASSGAATAKSSSRARLSSGTSGSGLKPGRDGKYEIKCPQCATVYKMPEQSLEAKFTCRNCDRTFFPKTTGGRRASAAAAQNQAKPFIIGGVLLVGLIVVGVIISNVSSGNTSAKSKRKQVDEVVADATNPRVDAGISWVTACATNDAFRFAQYSDLGALQAKLGVWPERPFATIPSTDYTDLAKAILEAMPENEDAAPLRELETPGSGSIDEKQARAAAGKVTVYWNMDAKEGWAAGRGQIHLSYTYANGVGRISDWMWDGRPRLARPKGGGKFVAHDQIAAPTQTEMEIDGQLMTIRESPIIPLDHLEDTPEAQRVEIDRLVSLLLDDSRGGNFNQAVDALKKIGRPAIPRLLNKIHELHGDLTGNNIQLSQLVRCLRVMTGAAHNYPVADHLKPNPQATSAERLSSLRQWFAFWYRYHKGEYDELIDKDEDLNLFGESPGAGKKQ